jgi:drug/metabolite transporter (DMT)-like permease
MLVTHIKYLLLEILSSLYVTGVLVGVLGLCVLVKEDFKQDMKHGESNSKVY